MAFESLSDFLAMGRHGIYVWSCFGIAAVCFGYLSLEDKLRRKKLLKRIDRLQRRGDI